MRYSERNSKHPTVTGRARIKMIAEFMAWYEGHEPETLDVSPAWRAFLRSRIHGVSNSRRRYKVVPE